MLRLKENTFILLSKRKYVTLLWKENTLHYCWKKLCKFTFERKYALSMDGSLEIMTTNCAKSLWIFLANIIVNCNIYANRHYDKYMHILTLYFLFLFLKISIDILTDSVSAISWCTMCSVMVNKLSNEIMTCEFNSYLDLHTPDLALKLMVWFLCLMVYHTPWVI